MVSVGHTMMLVRRIVLWAVPAALVAALAWSLLPPRGGSRPEARLRAPAVGGHEAAAGGAAREPAASAKPNASAPAPGAGSPGGVPGGRISVGNLVDTDAFGRRRWQITAATVSMAKGGEAVSLRDVHAVFYDPRGAPMTVSGAEGRYDTRTKDVVITGHVHGVASDGRQIYADRLTYSSASRQVTGTGNVRVVEERVIMYADRMVSNTQLGQTRFFGHVHMTVR